MADNLCPECGYDITIIKDVSYHKSYVILTAECACGASVRKEEIEEVKVPTLAKILHECTGIRIND